MSSSRFPSGSTTTPGPFSPPTIILEPTSSPKDQFSGDDCRVPVWTWSSEVGHDFFEGSYELPETKFAKELKDVIGELTEEEHEEMSGWLGDYLLTDLGVSECSVVVSPVPRAFPRGRGSALAFGT